MSVVLREFKGNCRGVGYNYKLMQVEDELILESYKDGECIDHLTWDNTPYNLDLVNKACDTIQGRK